MQQEPKKLLGSSASQRVQGCCHSSRPGFHLHAPHPDISPLIDDAVALHRKELWGPVRDGAPLGCPILEQWGTGHRWQE